MDSSLRDKIAALKAEWASLQPLEPKHEDRLWKKFRLEWDYHSNHIEGNTLTYGETEQLIIFGDARGNHTLREYEEMKAHDVAIAHVREEARAKKELSEADIRNLNQLILKEPFWKEAITPNGQPTRKEIVPGRYKVQPNNVRTATGEFFPFAEPLDVPARMRDYMQTLNSGYKPEGDLLAHLAFIHHEFLLIHPFDDGNGRVARLLLNFVLLKLGYPPLVIKTQDKKIYLEALHRADTSERDLSALEEFLGKNLVWSLELGIKAAKGEPVEEPLDIEKKIDLLIKKETQNKADILKKSNQTLHSLYDESWRNCFIMVIEKIKKFDKIFESRDISVSSNIAIPGSIYGTDWLNILDYLFKVGPPISLQQINITIQLKGYQGGSKRPFTTSYGITLSLEEYKYHILSPPISKLYSEKLSSEDEAKLTQAALEFIYDNIQANLK